ncbi:hypothetical protein ACLOAV_008343 [Pseudogymnoascus australis]
MAASPEIPAKARGIAPGHHGVILADNPYAEIDLPWDSDLLNRISPATFHPQPQSLLFALPTELRLNIFTLVLSQYEDTSHAYTFEEDPQLFQYYRPGCTAPARIDTAFLYTCRRFFYEARHLPMLNAIHRFWMTYPPRNCIGLSENEMFGRVQFRALTRQNLADVTEIQFFTQPSDLQYQPSMSYFDMWEFWRGPNALPGLRRGRRRGMKMKTEKWPTGLELVRLELEVPELNEDRMKDLEELVANLRRDVTFTLRDGTVLAPPQDQALTTRRWTVPLTLVEKMEEELGAKDVLRRSFGDDLRLYVAVIEWKRVTGPSDG